MYAIKHVSGILEFSTTNEYVEEGAICIEIPDGTYPKSKHFYDIVDGELIDMNFEFSSENAKENEDEDADLG